MPGVIGTVVSCKKTTPAAQQYITGGARRPVGTRLQRPAAALPFAS